MRDFRTCSLSLRSSFGFDTLCDVREWFTSVRLLSTLEDRLLESDSVVVDELDVEENAKSPLCRVLSRRLRDLNGTVFPLPHCLTILNMNTYQEVTTFKTVSLPDAIFNKLRFLKIHKPVKIESVLSHFSKSFIYKLLIHYTYCKMSIAMRSVNCCVW